MPVVQPVLGTVRNTYINLYKGEGVRQREGDRDRDTQGDRDSESKREYCSVCVCVCVCVCEREREREREGCFHKMCIFVFAADVFEKTDV